VLYGELPTIHSEAGDVQGVTVRVPNPLKVAILRLPTTEEMLVRLGQQKSIRRDLGRRKSQTEYVPNTKADLDLFNKIRLDKDGPEFDEFEASTAISKVTYCEVIDCQRAGEEYQVTLRTSFGEVKHWVRIPTQRDISIYRRGMVSAIELPHGQQELRYRTEPAIELYDAVAAKIEGYSASYKPADVPPHHKSAVAVELVNAIDDLDPTFDPNS
jgi:hypothetical protein